MSSRPIDLNFFDSTWQLAVEALLNVGLIVRRSAASEKLTKYELADPRMIGSWSRLLERAQKDQAFLLWRQSLEKLVARYDQLGIQYLSGEDLDFARREVVSRQNELSSIELKIVNESLETAATRDRLQRRNKWLHPLSWSVIFGAILGLVIVVMISSIKNSSSRILPFTVTYTSEPFGEAAKGTHIFRREQPNAWTDTFENKIDKRYKVRGKISVGNCTGQDLVKLAKDNSEDTREQIFIPDPECPNMQLRYRVNGGSWQPMGTIQ